MIAINAYSPMTTMIPKTIAPMNMSKGLMCMSFMLSGLSAIRLDLMVWSNRSLSDVSFSFPTVPFAFDRHRGEALLMARVSMSEAKRPQPSSVAEPIRPTREGTHPPSIRSGLFAFAFAEPTGYLSDHDHYGSDCDKC